MECLKDNAIALQMFVVDMIALSYLLRSKFLFFPCFGIVFVFYAFCFPQSNGIFNFVLFIVTQ